MIYIIIKTLITAIVVVTVAEIAKRSSLFAGLLVSIPLTSFLAFIWLYWEKRDSQMVIDLSYSILLMVIPSLTFFIILPLTLKFNNSFTLSMILATISTILAYWIFTLMINKIGINF